MPIVQLRPIVSAPDQLALGETALVTCAIEVVGEWPYGDQAFDVACLMDAWPDFSSTPQGRPNVVVGASGSQAPASWILTPKAAGPARVRITLFNPAGLRITGFALDMEITAPEEPARAGGAPS